MNRSARARANPPEVDRCRRVSELIRRELSILLAREVDDRRIRLVSITAVKVTRDLKQADVYVSSVESSVAAPEIEQTLNHARKYLRYLLSQHIHLKTTPDLRFKYDDSIRHGVEMSARIASLNQPDAPKHGSP